MKSDNITKDKSYAFALKIIKVHNFLSKEQHEFILSKQILRCGTAIGALVWEAEHAQSYADFINKMNIALKEANETSYWLMLLKDSGYMDIGSYESLHHDCIELVRLLASIIKTSKANTKKTK